MGRSGLDKHWQDGKITVEDALAKAQRQDDLAKRIVAARRAMEEGLEEAT